MGTRHFIDSAHPVRRVKSAGRGGANSASLFPALLDLSFALKFFGFLLEVESHAYIPLPVCVEAAASAAFHIAVEVAVLSHLEGGTDSVHEPSITEVFVDVDTPFRTGHRYPAVPGKVMIPVGLEIDLAFSPRSFPKLKPIRPMALRMPS